MKMACSWVVYSSISNRCWALWVKTKQWWLSPELCQAEHLRWETVGFEQTHTPTRWFSEVHSAMCELLVLVLLVLDVEKSMKTLKGWF